jgi:hypothetical protein
MTTEPPSLRTDGYSPELQLVYPLAIPRQRTGYSDSHFLDVEVVQLLIGTVAPIKHSSGKAGEANHHRPYRQTGHEAHSARFRIDSPVVLQVGENL